MNTLRHKKRISAIKSDAASRRKEARPGLQKMYKRKQRYRDGARSCTHAFTGPEFIDSVSLELLSLELTFAGVFSCWCTKSISCFLRLAYGSDGKEQLWLSLRRLEESKTTFFRLSRSPGQDVDFPRYSSGLRAAACPWLSAKSSSLSHQSRTYRDATLASRDGCFPFLSPLSLPSQPPKRKYVAIGLSFTCQNVHGRYATIAMNRTKYIHSIYILD